jgi:mono/diheme cytochrome c family protein
MRPPLRHGPNRLLRIALALLVLVGIGAGIAATVWWKFFAQGEQVFADDMERFKYGSLGGDLIAGIPYPVFMILPRVFPDLVEKHARHGYGPDKYGHGGYGAFGFPWEPGQRLPVGFSIRKRGFDRVTVNCAACHTTSWRLAESELPRIAPGGPSHTADVQALLGFLFDAAEDARFTPTRLMPEIALQFDMSALDWALYSFVIIPKTKLALKFARAQMGWMASKPAWGPGRDDAFNLPKYVLTQSPWDETVGNTDFPALWRMGERAGHLVHWGGEAKTVRAVIATSALGTGALPVAGFAEKVAWLESFLHGMAPPAWPLPIDAALAQRGGQLFLQHCSNCHARGGARTGTAIPLQEIGTDPEHVNTFRQADADRMNRLTSTLGLRDAALQGAQGYVARPLVGVWLLAPYLHNGAVPTVADLLSPPAERPAVFHRGHDVVDPERLGFVATGPAAEARGFRFDTRIRGNGNGGHLHGTELPPDDKRALIEFLKTL